MAVYDLRDRGGRGGVSVNDLLYMVGGQFVNHMMARDAAARQYKYADRLATSADARRAEAVNAANARQDDLIRRHDAYYRENPNGVQGAGGLMGTLLALGGKGDLSQMAPYVLSTPQTVNAGDKIISRQLYPNGEAGSEMSWNMGIDPLKDKELALKKEQDLWEREYKDKALAQQAALSRASLNRPHSAQLMPDGKGGMVWVDPYTRSIVPAGGITPSAGSGASPLETLSKVSTAYKNFYGGGSGGGLGIADDGAAAPSQMDPMQFLQIMGLLGDGDTGAQKKEITEAGLQGAMKKYGLSRDEALRRANDDGYVLRP